jgi:hypothetical protein
MMNIKAAAIMIATVYCVCATKSPDTVVPEVQTLLQSEVTYGAADVDPTPGYQTDNGLSGTSNGVGWPSMEGTMAGDIDDPSDANPGSGEGGEGTDNSDGLNKLVGGGKTSDMGPTKYGYGVKSPGYTPFDTSMDKDGHYYLGPSRRRVGAGFGRRRNAAPPPPPTPQPTNEFGKPEETAEKEIDDVIGGPAPAPAPQEDVVKELEATPAPAPADDGGLANEGPPSTPEEDHLIPPKELIVPTPPPTPTPTAEPTETPTPFPTPSPTAFTLLLRVTTGKEDYADSNMKVKMKITGSNGDYTGYFYGGHKGQVKLSTLHPKKGGHEYDFGEIKKAEISSNSGNGWYFTKFEVKSGSRPWTQLGCTDQWLDGKIDDTPYGGSGLYGTHIDLHPVDHHCAAKVPDDWGTKTKTGCFCKNHGKSGKCAKHGSSYAWCRTMNNCKGHSSGGGNWDKCTPGPKDQ